MEVLPFAVLGHVEGILSSHTEMARCNVNELDRLFFEAKFRFEACHQRNAEEIARFRGEDVLLMLGHGRGGHDRGLCIISSIHSRYPCSKRGSVVSIAVCSKTSSYMLLTDWCGDHARLRCMSKQAFRV